MVHKLPIHAGVVVPRVTGKVGCNIKWENSLSKFSKCKIQYIKLDRNNIEHLNYENYTFQSYLAHRLLIHEIEEMKNWTTTKYPNIDIFIFQNSNSHRKVK